MSSLSKPKFSQQESDTCTTLFCTKREAADHNESKLKECLASLDDDDDTRTMVYKCQNFPADRVDKAAWKQGYDSLVAQEEVVLCQNAQVMCIGNINDKIKNDCRGVIIGFQRNDRLEGFDKLAKSIEDHPRHFSRT